MRNSWLLTAIALLPLPLVAEENLFALSLEELMQVKITASTLNEESLRSTPAAVSVFTHEQIQQLGIDYLHELMNLVPGFQAFRQEEAGNEYYHSVRGHRSSTASREVLILLDGQRLNREFDNAMAIPMLLLGSVEKVEFIRGPGSAIHGSNAFSGIISITTSKDQNTLALSHSNNSTTLTQWQLAQAMGAVQMNLHGSLQQSNG